mgnify:CR=1 FL=1
MITPEHIINIDKPMDWTSFDVVRKVRYTTRIKKVGHAGTLDPFATGVLIVLTGKNTKRQNEFMDMPKTYDAEILLGNQTDTGDRTGTIVETAPVLPSSNVVTNALGISATIPANIIKDINGVYFNMIGSEQKEVGVLAQDVQKALPEAVSVVDEENGYLGVSYVDLVPVLIEGMKEQQKQIEALKARIKTMENK